MQVFSVPYDDEPDAATSEQVVSIDRSLTLRYRAFAAAIAATGPFLSSHALSHS